MSAITPLLPSSVSLSSDTAIEAILSDIPLFCEGVMGIGVITFFFITKQVKLLSVFLYGSSFLAFAAAILDLGQVLTRGPQNVVKGVGLETVTGFIYAREVSLSLSIGLLDLFFWKLVANCPRNERNLVSNSKDDQKAKKVHSASWDRWGVIGMLLKWVNFAALLAVPLLQILWRLLPTQRRYGSIYVADTTIQTSIMGIFILKLVLNISISPLDCWSAFRYYSVPMGALSIGAGLGIANFALFAFTETSLGRFLRAVQVYLLILHSLYTTFQDIVPPVPSFKEEDGAIHSGSALEKLPGDGLLPVAYSYRPDSLISYGGIVRPTDANNRFSNIPSFVKESNQSSRSSASDVGERAQDAKSIFDTSPTPMPIVNDSSMKTERVASRIYVATENSQGLQQVAWDQYSYPEAISSSRNADATSIVGQGSISSIDDLLRQQNELDQSIAALRVLSLQGESYKISSRTESLSNRSDFSLSVFPDPPTIPKTETVSRYLTESSLQPIAAGSGDEENTASGGRKVENQLPPQVTTPLSLSSADQVDEINVTPFVEVSIDDFEMISPAIKPSIVLRPMILTSTIITSPTEQSLPPTGSITLSTQEMTNPAPTTDPVPNLRPLFLGKRTSSFSQSSNGMLSLAQRRQRGGTISSNTRRPVISAPRLNKERTEAAPGAFERPRPPPLRSLPEGT